MTNSRSYYFAYGSNLSKEQMFSRCPESDYLMPGKLLDYSWLITKRGYASVKPSTEDLVLGEIFCLNQQDIEYLDVFESVGEGMYDKEIISIQTEDGVLDCLVYIATDQRQGKPQTEYIARINAGIKSANLPHDYVNKYIRPFIPKNQ